MAVLTLWVTFLVVDVAAAASAGVSWTPWPPARPSGDPADLTVTDSATQPITALLFLHDDAALRAVHGLPGEDQGLEQISSSAGCRVVLSTGRKVILVLLTVHPFMNRLAEQAVVLVADGAVEHIDGVLVHTPPGTVWAGTVVTALTARLCHRQTSLQPALVLLFRHQGSDLSPLQGAVTGVRVITVRTGHLRVLTHQDY